MLISDHFGLGRKQAALDFVDVDTSNDLPVFIDPRAIRLLRSDWGHGCVALIQQFFKTVVDAIRAGDDKSAVAALAHLREPRETRLGLSKVGNRGRAVGSTLASDVREALSKSKAVTTGLLQDLEDTILMVDNVSYDIVSDISTNLIRRPLIEYTQRVCQYHHIPVEQVDSGPLWDPDGLEWYNEFVSLPSVDNQKLLLVPKAIVRRSMEYNVGEYHNDYILEHLRQIELANPKSNLVKTIKSTGERKVTNKALVEKYGRNKGMILDLTIKAPKILENYKKDKELAPQPPMSNDELVDAENAGATDWDALFRAVHTLPTGRPDAAAYENSVEALLTALFYPYLTNPDVQSRIHEGRKRIDIAYTNIADAGFFHWIATRYRSPFVFVECKNYGGEVGNPELDQISGRFSPNRGQVGLLVVRSFDDKAAFLRRCKDTATDQRGFIIALDDGDLNALVQARKFGDDSTFPLLQRRFTDLVA